MSARREKLMAKIFANCIINLETGCWIWNGRNSGNGRGGGYGRMEVDGHTCAVHRVVYTLWHGYIAAKRQVDHKCHTRLCCNPDHLEDVTHLKNQRRKRKQNKNGTNTGQVGQALPPPGSVCEHLEQGPVHQVWGGDSATGQDGGLSGLQRLPARV